MAPVTKSCSSGAGIDVFDGIRAGRLQQISIDVDGECSRIEKVERSRLQIDGKEVSFESLDLHPPPERRVLAVCIDRRQAQYEARRPGNGRALGESISCPSVGVLHGTCQHEIEEDEGRRFESCRDSAMGVNINGTCGSAATLSFDSTGSGRENANRHRSRL